MIDPLRALTFDVVLDNRLGREPRPGLRPPSRHPRRPPLRICWTSPSAVATFWPQSPVISP